MSNVLLDPQCILYTFYWLISVFLYISLKIILYDICDRIFREFLFKWAHLVKKKGFFNTCIMASRASMPKIRYKD